MMTGGDGAAVHDGRNKKVKKHCKKKILKESGVLNVYLTMNIMMKKKMTTIEKNKR